MLIKFLDTKTRLYWMDSHNQANEDLEMMEERVVIRNGNLLLEKPFFSKEGSLFKRVGWLTELGNLFIFPRIETKIFGMLGLDHFLDEMEFSVAPSTSRVIRYAKLGIGMHLVHIIHGINAQRDVEGAYCRIEHLQEEARTDLIQKFKDTPGSMWGDNALVAMSRYLGDQMEDGNV